jgi:tryptophanyl-tRNA synthetase
MRPTGRMHLGNWVGALENWVRLQRSEQYATFFMVADLHALTTGYEDTRDIRSNTEEMVLDWIAAGIDPERSPIFVQSRIPAHAELHLVFSMLVTVPRLERNPTLKELIVAYEMRAGARPEKSPTLKEQLHLQDLEEHVSYGLLGYPVLQAADILLYKGDTVPVGEDQVPHVELTREIARRFNHLYRPLFPEPEPLLTTVPRLPGLDGTMKMSKSAGNTVLLTDEPANIRTAIRRAVTDPKKIRRGDPGRPEVCTVYNYHTVFNPAAEPEVAAGCRSGALGCVDCKNKLADALIEKLAPLRERRAELQSTPHVIGDVLDDGVRRASHVARETMEQVWEAMHFTAPKVPAT